MTEKSDLLGATIRANNAVQANLRGKSPRGKSGKIIAVNPEARRQPFLAEFPGWQDGHSGGRENWDKPWYSPEHRTPSQSRWWLSRNEFDVIEEAPLRSSEKETSAPVKVETEGLVLENSDFSGGRGLAETNRSWLKLGDIVFRDRGESWSSWAGSRKEVTGFEKSGRLWAKDPGSPGLGGYTDRPEGLSLLERPGWRFKVGDTVRAVSGPAAGCRGNVIVLNPEKNYLCLVFFKDWQGGSPEIENCEEAWFPLKYRDQNRSFNSSCLWLEEHELEKG